MLYTPGLYVADTLRETISIGIRRGDPLLALQAFAQLDTAGTGRRGFLTASFMLAITFRAVEVP